MVNYFLKFLLYLFIVMELLRCLEDKDVEWYWNEVYERVFIDVKWFIISYLVLCYYDVLKEVIL